MFSTRRWSTSAAFWRPLRREAGGWRPPGRRRCPCGWSNFRDPAVPAALNAGGGTLSFFGPSVFAPDVDKVAVAPLDC
ncbi:hypothetical protein [Streptomyces sp. MA5143a]|uniref:hypothetical protein n=1 Tax=Streptomyces sp. MA5143a TaxID=2083010 RepID=UPI000D19A114|nr:hypothetical protein [Streptomyces sp. MA5143a]SPF06721.1 hypothetical protein SMA5143A_7563 [Streptomyces sp. MA5143a]